MFLKCLTAHLFYRHVCPVLNKKWKLWGTEEEVMSRKSFKSPELNHHSMVAGTKWGTNSMRTFPIINNTNCSYSSYPSQSYFLIWPIEPLQPVS